MPGLITLILLLLSSYSFAARFIRNGLGLFLLSYLFFTGEIWLIAQGLSAAEKLSEGWLWLTASFLFFLSARAWKTKWIFSGREFVYLWPIGILVLLSAALGLAVRPGNWDGITYILPRALFYLQFGSFADFPASYWAQRTHPLLGPVWLAFTIVASNYRENFFFLPQFAAWLVLGFATAGIVTLISPPSPAPKRRLFFALTLALFPLMNLMGANTEKNDLLVAAYGAVSFYFLLSAFRFRILFSLLALAFSLAVKASTLPLLPVWGLAAWSLRKRGNEGWAVGAVAALAIIASSGYGKNFYRYGNFLGPSAVLAQHSFHDAAEALSEGRKNIFRFTVDALTPDGWPGVRAADQLVSLWRVPAIWALESLDLQHGKIYSEFPSARPSLAHEDPVYYGLAYLLLGFFALAFFWGVREKRILLWSLPAPFLFLAHAFSTWYDPWHGRFFMVCGIFFIPLLVGGVERAWETKSSRLAAAALILFLFAQSAYALFYRNNSPFGETSRIAQVLRNRPELVPVFLRLDSLVSERDSIATKIAEDLPEYLLFGPGFSRVVISTQDFERGNLPVPPNMQWLFFQAAYEPAQNSDIPLGQGFFLRKL